MFQSWSSILNRSSMCVRDTDCATCLGLGRCYSMLIEAFPMISRWTLCASFEINFILHYVASCSFKIVLQSASPNISDQGNAHNVSLPQNYPFKFLMTLRLWIQALYHIFKGIQSNIRWYFRRITTPLLLFNQYIIVFIEY